MLQRLVQQNTIYDRKFRSTTQLTDFINTSPCWLTPLTMARVVTAVIRPTVFMLMSTRKVAPAVVLVRCTILGVQHSIVPTFESRPNTVTAKVNRTIPVRL